MNILQGEKSWCFLYLEIWKWREWFNCELVIVLNQMFSQIIKQYDRIRNVNYLYFICWHMKAMRKANTPSLDRQNITGKRKLHKIDFDPILHDFNLLCSQLRGNRVGKLSLINLNRESTFWILVSRESFGFYLSKFEIVSRCLHIQRGIQSIHLL